MTIQKKPQNKQKYRPMPGDFFTVTPSARHRIKRYTVLPDGKHLNDYEISRAKEHNDVVFYCLWSGGGQIVAEKIYRNNDMALGKELIFSKDYVFEPCDPALLLVLEIDRNKIVEKFSDLTNIYDKLVDSSLQNSDEGFDLSEAFENLAPFMNKKEE